MTDVENKMMDTSDDNGHNFNVIEIDVKTEAEQTDSIISSSNSPNKENNFTLKQKILKPPPAERVPQRPMMKQQHQQQSATFANGSAPTNNALHECNRCEAMFRSKDLYEYHRKICYGGKDQPRYCKICGVRKESEWLMGKHLLEHCDISKGKCLACDWTSELAKDYEKTKDPKVFNELMKDIGSHLNRNHMIKADELVDGVPPKRTGFFIAPESLRCIECGKLQDDVKSLQEHLKVCVSNSKARFYICYCEAEFSDRTLFHHHINLFQCARTFSASKLMPPQGLPPNAQFGLNKLDPKGTVVPGINGNGLLKDGLKRNSPPKEWI